jgi:hypothetical protein
VTCYKQALFGLAWFRDKADIPRLGAGFGLAQSTAYRYLNEVTEVLAACAPGLHETLERDLAGGLAYLILDGKIVGTEPVPGEDHQPEGRDDRPVVCGQDQGKTHDFGGNIQALFSPSGIPLWVSDVLPGNVHDLAAAHQNVLSVLRPYLKNLPVLADLGYDGARHGIHVR